MKEEKHNAFVFSFSTNHPKFLTVATFMCLVLLLYILVLSSGTFSLVVQSHFNSESSNIWPGFDSWMSIEFITVMKRKPKLEI